jgi:hypothetical protein
VSGIEGGEAEEGADGRKRRGALVVSVEAAALLDCPQGQQVSGEVGLGGAELAALGGGAAGARSGHPRGLLPRPLGGLAVHREGDAMALRGERLGRERLAGRG